MSTTVTNEPTDYIYRHMKAIADGTKTYYREFEELYYYGQASPSNVAQWLLQFDDTWTVLADEELGLSVQRGFDVPYSVEQIKAAVDYLRQRQVCLKNPTEWT